MAKNEKQDAWQAFGQQAGSYGEAYTNVDFGKGYPANNKRLEIALSILEKAKPKNVLDVGCGTGDPMIAMMKAGHDVQGFDFAEEMVAQARATVAKAGFEENRVSRNNMEAPSGFEAESFEAITALGALYYAQNFSETVSAVSNLLQPGGHLVFSLRNDLFSLFSMNKYSAEFISRKLVDPNTIPNMFKDDFGCDLEKMYEVGEVERIFDTVDDENIHSVYHNPLTVQEEVLDPVGLKLRGIYYYHFHIMPPKYEHLQPEEFRRLSWEAEDPTDWRGIFMASAFVVHATKD
jgi:2-polyprenyl-3-methyl-5-hydroxy-6-metoxy-1,4-benzoquinol methylase